MLELILTGGLRELRTRAGLTQQDVATALRVQRQAVGHWEAGRWLPRAQRLADLLRLLELRTFDAGRGAAFARQRKATAGVTSTLTTTR